MASKRMSKKSNESRPAGPAQRLGALLQQARQAAGLSLQSLSDQTKIQPRLLEALERGDLRDLPSPAHGRGFVRNVARACGAPEAQALALFDESLGLLRAAALPQPVAAPVPKAAAKPAEAKARSKQPRPDAGAGFWRLAAFAAVGVLLLVALLSLAWAHRPAAPSAARAVDAAALPGKPEGGPDAAPAPAVAKAAKPEGGQAQDSEELVLRAKKATWASLLLDGQALPLVALAHGEKRHFQVQARAVLLLGDASAVRLWWRGENLGYLGAKPGPLNGLVFERGMKWHKDSAQDLPQPEGAPVPEAADDSASAASDGALGD
jgi:transcriptional regulator with XRE-family HTH domain